MVIASNERHSFPLSVTILGKPIVNEALVGNLNYFLKLYFLSDLEDTFALVQQNLSVLVSRLSQALLDPEIT